MWQVVGENSKLSLLQLFSPVTNDLSSPVSSTLLSALSVTHIRAYFFRQQSILLVGTLPLWRIQCESATTAHTLTVGTPRAQEGLMQLLALPPSCAAPAGLKMSSHWPARADTGWRTKKAMSWFFQCLCDNCSQKKQSSLCQVSASESWKPSLCQPGPQQ